MLPKNGHSVEKKYFLYSIIKIYDVNRYSLIQKNGYTFAIVYSSKCVTVFLNQMLGGVMYISCFLRKREEPKPWSNILKKGGK